MKAEHNLFNTGLPSLAFGGCWLHLGKPIHNCISFCYPVIYSIMMTNCWGLIVVSLGDLVEIAGEDVSILWIVIGGTCAGTDLHLCVFVKVPKFDLKQFLTSWQQLVCLSSVSVSPLTPKKLLN